MDSSVVMSQFSMLPDELKQEVADLITYLSNKSKMQSKKKRKFGAAKGMFIMSPDFDEPLDDFKEYMS